MYDSKLITVASKKRTTQVSITLTCESVWMHQLRLSAFPVLRMLIQEHKQHHGNFSYAKSASAPNQITAQHNHTSSQILYPTIVIPFRGSTVLTSSLPATLAYIPAARWPGQIHFLHLILKAHRRHKGK